jgi:putative membrane protein
MQYQKPAGTDTSLNPSAALPTLTTINVHRPLYNAVSGAPYRIGRHFGLDWADARRGKLQPSEHGAETMADPTTPRANTENTTTRHDYSLDRTVLANERTYTAWIRTGLASLAAGIAVEKLLYNVMAAWSLRSIAFILILFSAVAFFLAAWRYTHLGIAKERSDIRTVPVIVTSGTSIVLILCSLIAIVDLWLTKLPG